LSEAKNILAVFNCCGLMHDNIGPWLVNLDALANQHKGYPNFKICISGCGISPESKDTLSKWAKESPLKTYLSWIEDHIPVNQTFNKSVEECEKVEKFDAFWYLASDVTLVNTSRLAIKKDQDILKQLVEAHYDHDSAMTSLVVDHDGGFREWFGFTETSDNLKHNYEIPVGRTVNLHTTLFDRSILDRYGRVIPDIFRTFATESVFSFVAAGVNKCMIVHNNSIIVKHTGMMDGRSVCELDDIKKNNANWAHIFGDIPARERLCSREASDVGFGVEEKLSFFRHNRECYENNRAKDPEPLADFIKKACYLSEDEIDYDEIHCEFIEA